MKKRGGFFSILFVALAGFGIWWFFLREVPVDEVEEPSSSDSEESETTTSQDEEETEENDEEEEEESDTDFSDFSEETQNVGEDDVEGEYMLVSIDNEEKDGYHRFIFTLDSDDEEKLPNVEAALYSTGGYIRVLLDKVTSDESGIDYQASESINKDGVVRIYHDVTANESEEVYNIGILSDAEFYLHSDDMTVILDVKYPGEAEASDYEDPDEFLSEDVELEGTNEDGSARISGYTWGTEGGIVKFVWETASASGNPTPPTSVTYSEDEIVVTFSGLSGDIMLNDGSFEKDLTSGVDRVEGTVSGDDHIYTFYLDVESEYKIYRELSPNQVVIEIQ